MRSKLLIIGIILIAMLGFSYIFYKSKPQVEVYTDLNQYEERLASKKESSKWYKWEWMNLFGHKK